MKKLLVPLIILLLPIAEIAGFIIVGRWIGVLPTLLLIVATSIAGAMLLRIQGIAALRRVQQEPGRQPGQQIVNGVMIFLAGLLLIVPGFLTDIFGVLLFVPAIRKVIWTAFGAHVSVRSFSTGPFGSRSRSNPAHDETTIDLSDAEFNRTDVKTKPVSRLDKNDLPGSGL